MCNVLMAVQKVIKRFLPCSPDISWFGGWIAEAVMSTCESELRVFGFTYDEIVSFLQCACFLFSV